MAKLDQIEQQIVATALLAMWAECPEDERPEIQPILASISRKLSLAEAYGLIAEQARAAREGVG